jgi:hypothetical protein
MKLETFIVLKTMNIDKCSKKWWWLWFVQVHVIISSFPTNISLLSFLYDFVNMHQCMRMQCDCD